MTHNDKMDMNPGREDREPRTLLPMLVGGLVLITVGMTLIAIFV